MDATFAAVDMRQFLNAQSPAQLETLRFMLNQMHHDTESKDSSKKHESQELKNNTLSKAVAKVSKRPLNSYMCWRAYYSVLFDASKWTQKDRSAILKSLWCSDLLKGKWTIAAKAYSTLRDALGKEKAPLSEYLASVAPLLDVPAPESYLQMFGWHIDFVDKTLTRLYVPPETNFQITTTLSPADIVAFCNTIGYCQLPVASESTTITMAVNGAQPSSSPSTMAAVTPSPSELVIQASQENAANSQSATDFSLADGLKTFTELQMEIHENNALLAHTGDTYPFVSQFCSLDGSKEGGLFVDPLTDSWTAFCMGEFIDYTVDETL